MGSALGKRVAHHSLALHDSIASSILYSVFIYINSYMLRNIYSVLEHGRHLLID